MRQATDADAEAVATLNAAINALGAEPPPVRMTPAIVRRDLLGPAPRAILRVGELDGAVVGFATAGFIYDGERAADALMLLDLYVMPAARRRGVARALMADLAALAVARGAGCVWWGVDVGDVEAFAFYDAIGAADEGPFHGRLLAGAALTTLAAVSSC